jgi:hypothetical protein
MVNGTEFPSQEMNFDVGSSQGDFAGIGDKATGMLLEAAMSYGGQSLNIIASSTSMGGGEPLGLGWWIWIVVIAAIVAVVVGVSLLLRKRKQAAVIPPQPEILLPPPKS